MKCELCNSDRWGHESRLCEPCTEAIVRLWTIANNTCPPTNGAQEGVAGSSKSQRGRCSPGCRLLLSDEHVANVFTDCESQKQTAWPH